MAIWSAAATLPDDRWTRSPAAALCFGRAVLWFAFCVGAVGARAQEVTTGSYRARWQEGGVELLTVGGQRLAWWPMGAACSPADPALPACPAPDRTPVGPASEVSAGVTVWRWQFAFPAPCPITAQVETATFLQDRIEMQVRVLWRGPAPRLARLVYGGRLLAGCVDLEGLWEMRAAAGGDAPWLPAPVPGLFTDPGAFVYRRSVGILAAAGDAVLLLGGADDEDVCLVNGASGSHLRHRQF